MRFWYDLNKIFCMILIWCICYSNTIQTQLWHDSFAILIRFRRIEIQFKCYFDENLIWLLSDADTIHMRFWLSSDSGVNLRRLRLRFWYDSDPMLVQFSYGSHTVLIRFSSESYSVARQFKYDFETILIPLLFVVNTMRFCSYSYMNQFRFSDDSDAISTWFVLRLLDDSNANLIRSWWNIHLIIMLFSSDADTILRRFTHEFDDSYSILMLFGFDSDQILLRFSYEFRDVLIRIQCDWKRFWCDFSMTLLNFERDSDSIQMQSRLDSNSILTMFWYKSGRILSFFLSMHKK